jgi:hypothetical protein
MVPVLAFFFRRKKRTAATAPKPRPMTPTPTPIPACAPTDNKTEEAGADEVGAAVLEDVVDTALVAVEANDGLLEATGPMVVWLRWVGMKVKLALFAPFPDVVLGRKSNQHGESLPEKSKRTNSDELFAFTLRISFSGFLSAPIRHWC